MFNWTNINKILIYDGTLEGLFTCVFDMFKNKTLPLNIITKDNPHSLSLIDEFIEVPTDYNKSYRVFSSLNNNLPSAMYYVYNGFLCANEAKEMHILKYMIYAYKYGENVDNMHELKDVFAIHALAKKTTLEAHRFMGFVRFSEIGENLFYSKIEPDNNIMEALCRHFKNRLPSQNWIIHDSKRNIAGVYNTNEYEILENSQIKIPKTSQKEKEYQDLWKLFFNTVAIESRKNERQQTLFMPKRYWKNILEVH